MSLNAVTAALKAKAPIVAIPIENHAPVCVERKRLAAWAKGVTLTHAEVTGGELYTTTEYERPKGYHAEGPVNQIQVQHRTPRRLVLKGTAGSVKTRCEMIPIDRRTAVNTLANWSEKERLKLEKKTLLGALATAKAKRALKLATYASDGEGMITAQAVYEDGKRRTVQGVPVTIPQLPELTFLVHRKLGTNGETLDNAWAVSETTTGQAAGFGKTAEEAILNARKNSAKASPERLQSIRNLVTAASAAVAA